MKYKFNSEVNAANASAFISIGNGKHHFFKGSIFSKKAYVVSTQEKNEIEEHLRSSMIRLGGVGALLATVSLMNLTLSIVLMVMFGIQLFISYKKLIKSILVDKKLVIVKNRSLSNMLNSQSSHYSYKDLLFRSIGFPLIVVGSYFAALDEINESKSFKVFAITMLIAAALVFIFSLVHMFFKLKKKLFNK